MPAIKSSSKGGDALTLYAHERRSFSRVYDACQWMGDHAPVCEAQIALDVCDLMRKLLAAIDGPKTTDAEEHET